VLYGGEACGYVITLEDGTRIYHAGDTAVNADMALIGEIYAPEIALLPIGDLYTMSPREAAVAVRMLNPKYVVPAHYGTSPALTGTPEALREELDRLKIKTEMVVLRPGESLT
jgi:L-ascorbate metabolism protein UlaG (beta-lactamase superfamily)